MKKVACQIHAQLFVNEFAEIVDSRYPKGWYYAVPYATTVLLDPAHAEQLIDLHGGAIVDHPTPEQQERIRLDEIFSTHRDILRAQDAKSELLMDLAFSGKSLAEIAMIMAWAVSGSETRQ